MDLVFVYEDKFAQDAQGNIYAGSAFSQAVFDRYLEHFDRVILLMRRSPVSPDDTEALSRMNRLDGDRISVVWLPDLTASLRSFFSLRLRRQLRNIIRENITPDRAVIIRVPSLSGRIAAGYCKKMGKPYLAEAVGCPWDSLWNHSLRGKLLAAKSWLQMRFCMKHASHAVYVTDEFLQRRYPTRGKSAPISDVELRPADGAVLEKRLEKIARHDGRTVIGTAAAVNVAFKGQRFVIGALAALKAQGRTDFEYRLAGGGDSSRLRALAQKRGVSDQVVFEGSLPHDRMFDWLDGLDLYIQPSTVEAMPRALIEAMSRGLPVLASEVGGIPELLGGSAIFPAKDTAAIADMLAALGKDSMSAMARANFARAADFEKAKLEKRRFDFYREFAEEAKESKA